MTGAIAELGGLVKGGHVCWVVGDEAAFGDLAAVLLAVGRELGRKTILFGPESSIALSELGPGAAIAVDPYVAFLDRGPIDPDAMLAMFREQSALARIEGHEGLLVVADMDWLLPARPGTDAIVGFEVLLDRVVAELDATVICAYRRWSFDNNAILGALCVHPRRWGQEERPPFFLIAGDRGSWRLSGEIDLAVLPVFGAAIAATTQMPCVIDVAGLGFIDVAGMRTIARVTRAANVSVRLLGAHEALRRLWHVARFDELSPTVELVA
ncbi:MAG: hypothetical protein JWO62_1789 [Acidimicrobiaceae bacterium]|jgi:anti-anti-sigma factor|nr:hypothetical protein [Acidimicrobiaceae bacterium]